MKTLILIRHAKSNWNDAEKSDYERSLNARGLSDAPIMAKRLQQRLTEKEQSIDAILSSSAQRADQTTRLLLTELNVSDQQIDWRRDLYLASPMTILKMIRMVTDDVQTLAVVAHNPGITELAEQFTGEFLGNVPTCGIITIALPINHWCDAGNWADLIHFDYPKKAP
ncbi:MAG: histidine phosphatase family protein [Mariprofundaceae bacterium]|nr:histidine phosphatase family protein [Mariprofundaceae bacterium]